MRTKDISSYRSGAEPGSDAALEAEEVFVGGG